jgi:hypothetical protein
MAGGISALKTPVILMGFNGKKTWENTFHEWGDLCFSCGLAFRAITNGKFIYTRRVFDGHSHFWPGGETTAFISFLLG